MFARSTAPEILLSQPNPITWVNKSQKAQNILKCDALTDSTKLMNCFFQDLFSLINIFPLGILLNSEKDKTSINCSSWLQNVQSTANTLHKLNLCHACTHARTHTVVAWLCIHSIHGEIYTKIIPWHYSELGEQNMTCGLNLAHQLIVSDHLTCGCPTVVHMGLSPTHSCPGQPVLHFWLHPPHACQWHCSNPDHCTQLPSWVASAATWVLLCSGRGMEGSCELELDPHTLG